MPDDGVGVTVELKFPEGLDDRLKGPGQPVINSVSKAGATRFVEDLRPGSFKVIPAPTDSFLRCDSNGDSRFNIADAIWTLVELFRNGPPSSCRNAADCDADGTIQLSDVMFAVELPFMGGAPPPPPYPACGFDIEATVVVLSPGVDSMRRLSRPHHSGPSSDIKKSTRSRNSSPLNESTRPSGMIDTWLSWR